MREIWVTGGEALLLCLALFSGGYIAGVILADAQYQDWLEQHEHEDFTENFERFDRWLEGYELEGWQNETFQEGPV